MMDWTDRHCRSFHRLLTRHALLYTEMVPVGAILHGDRARFLAFDAAEQPLALQLGGSDPGELAHAAAIAADWGYGEINLNCGCPSDRVQQGRFGACLMAEPALVRDCVAAMRAAVEIPVTVKCRIGIDEQDDEALAAFVDTVAESGCDTFVVHARKAWLKGLSPKENREIPPLRHALVRQLKAARPDVKIILNGGLTTLAQAGEALSWADGAMLGRAAYQEPWTLARVDSTLFGAADPLADRAAAVEALCALAERHCATRQPLKFLGRHVLGLMNGLPGARAWRRSLSEGLQDPAAGPQLFRRAAERLRLAEPTSLAA